MRVNTSQTVRTASWAASAAAGVARRALAASCRPVRPALVAPIHSASPARADSTAMASTSAARTRTCRSDGPAMRVNTSQTVRTASWPASAAAGVARRALAASCKMARPAPVAPIQNVRAPGAPCGAATTTRTSAAGLQTTTCLGSTKCVCILNVWLNFFYSRGGDERNEGKQTTT